MRLFMTVILCILCLGCSQAPPTSSTNAPSENAATQALHQLFADEWDFRLAENPLFATAAGLHDYNDQLPQVSVADHERRADVWRGYLARMADIDRAALSNQDKISYDMFRAEMENNIAEVTLREYMFPFNADSGFHVYMASMPRQVPLKTTQDFRNYIARLEALPKHFDQQIANLELAIEAGMVLPKVVLTGYESTIANHVVEQPIDSIFFTPFAKLPATVSEAEHAALRDAGRNAVMNAVVPAYRTFLTFFTEQYLPAARETVGAYDLPNGEAFYASRIKHFTTLDLTPDEIHEIGLREVARIRGEMQAVIDEVGFDGTFAEFLEFLRTDPQFYPESAEELLKEASYICKRMDGMLPTLFKNFPRQPYGVRPVPDHLAPKYTAGRYVSAPPEGKEPGLYWVNTYALESRSLYTLEALSLHEAVPGHHFQIALSRELTGLPNFRRYTYLSAFGEGWGLYSERLGLEVGFYTDPYSNFGRLTYEMWRACRLVVDTGVHAKGWTRQQVMDYMAENTALSLHEVRTETDRYISWPAQALAYKLGELKIRELRSRAENALGTAFDVRDFHDVVLRNGAVPLPVLEQQVDAYIAATPSEN